MKNILKSDYAKVYYFDIIAKIFSAFISIAIIRILSVGDYAEYTYFFSISSFLSGILGSGIGLAYTTYAVGLREENENLDIILFKELIQKMMMIYPLVAILCYLGINYILGGAKITILFGISYGLLLSINQINIVFFQSRKNYVRAGIISNLKSILLSSVLAIILIRQTGEGLMGIYVVYMVTIVGSICITYYIIARNFKKDIILNNHTKLFNNMIHDSIWTILYMFVISAFNQVDVMMLKLFRGPEAVANYGVAFKYYSLVISALPAIQVVLRVKSSSKEMKCSLERKRQVIKWMRKVTPLAIILLVVGIIGAHFFFPIINGTEYNDAIAAFNILMLGASISYITAPNVSIMVGAKKQKILFVLSLGSFFTNIIGNYLFIPQKGIMAAAMTTIIAHFVLNGGSTIYLLLEGSRLKQYNEKKHF